MEAEDSRQAGVAQRKSDLAMKRLLRVAERRIELLLALEAKILQEHQIPAAPGNGQFRERILKGIMAYVE